MAVHERVAADERDRLGAEILQKPPPIRQLEELLGPEPTLEEVGEVDAFLQARARWQQPYAAPRGGGRG